MRRTRRSCMDLNYVEALVLRNLLHDHNKRIEGVDREMAILEMRLDKHMETADVPQRSVPHPDLAL